MTMNDNFAQRCIREKEAGGGRTATKEKYKPLSGLPAPAPSTFYDSTESSKCKSLIKGPLMVKHQSRSNEEKEEAEVSKDEKGGKKEEEKEEPMHVRTGKAELPHVVKWGTDALSMYGTGFLLSDNSMTVCFKDSTRIVVRSIEAPDFTYYMKRKGQTVYSFNAVPGDRELEKKVSVFSSVFLPLLCDPSKERGCGISHLPCPHNRSCTSSLSSGACELRKKNLTSAALGLDSKNITHRGLDPRLPIPERTQRGDVGGSLMSLSMSTTTTGPSRLEINEIASSSDGAHAAERGGKKMHKTAMQPASPQNAWRRGRDIVCVEKWIKNEECYVFKLNNRSTQLVFFDGTELFLSMGTRKIRFVDLKKNCATHNLDDMGTGDDLMQRRCTYARELVADLTRREERDFDI